MALTGTTECLEELAFRTSTMSLVVSTNLDFGFDGLKPKLDVTPLPAQLPSPKESPITHRCTHLSVAVPGTAQALHQISLLTLLLSPSARQKLRNQESVGPSPLITSSEIFPLPSPLSRRNTVSYRIYLACHLLHCRQSQSIHRCHWWSSSAWYCSGSSSSSPLLHHQTNGRKHQRFRAYRS